MLHGYDISSYQAGIPIDKVPGDFVIIKATQGTSYRNPDFTRAASAALTAGKLMGFYHYAAAGTAAANAAHFINTISSYIGSGILCLDWESMQNPNYCNVLWVSDFVRIVKEQTGVNCFVYMSKSVTRSANWAGIAEEFPLWCAQYKDMRATGYQSAPWTDKHGFGAWDSCLIYQYSSMGFLPGWGHALDLDLAYMTPEEWKRHATPDFNKKEDGYRVGAYILKDIPYGSRGESVRFLQQLLAARGFDPGGIDGIFGRKTAAALSAFQSSELLTVCDQKTWERLILQK